MPTARRKTPKRRSFRRNPSMPHVIFHLQSDRGERVRLIYPVPSDEAARVFAQVMRHAAALGGLPPGAIQRVSRATQRPASVVGVRDQYDTTYAHTSADELRAEAASMGVVLRAPARRRSTTARRPTTKRRSTRKNPSAALSAAELTALRRYAAVEGRTWKASLRRDWMNGTLHTRFDWNTAALLQGLRNRLGPRWLAGFSLARPNPSVPCANSKKLDRYRRATVVHQGEELGLDGCFVGSKGPAYAGEWRTGPKKGKRGTITKKAVRQKASRSPGRVKGVRARKRR